MLSDLITTRNHEDVKEKLRKKTDRENSPEQHWIIASLEPATLQETTRERERERERAIMPTVNYRLFYEFCVVDIAMLGTVCGNNGVIN